MALIATQSILVTGRDLTFTNVSASDTCAPGVYLIAKNGGGSATTLTVTVPGNTKYGVANPVWTHSVPAGGQSIFGPLPLDLADPIAGTITFAFSTTTSVSVAVCA